jgi:hypothetical protein
MPDEMSPEDLERVHASSLLSWPVASATTGQGKGTLGRSWRDGAASVMALFSGSWSGMAMDAFADGMERRDVLDEDLVTQALQNSIDRVRARWNGLTRDEQFEEGWCGTTEGAAVFLSPGEATVFWLGGIHVWHIRGPDVISQNEPHTLQHALMRAGHPDVSEKYRGIVTRLFHDNGTFERLTWNVLPGDAIAITQRYIRGETQRSARWDPALGPQQMAVSLAQACLSDSGHRVSTAMVSVYS